MEPGSLAAGSRVIVDGDYHYLFRVRRVRAGDALTLFDGAGSEAAATVHSIATDHAVLAVDTPRPAGQPGRCRLTIAQALIKGERMDMCIQKLVELGVSAITPLHTERTVVKLTPERAHKRRQRFVEIARDAARQSRRATVPDINEISYLDTLLMAPAATELRLVLWERERGRALRDALPAAVPASACVLVGPEGGLSDAEVERAASAGWITVGLGPYILRAETASMAAAAMIGFAFGSMGE